MNEQELRELDAHIAEHVMGFEWRRLNRRDTVNRLVSPEAIKRGFGLYDPLPNVGFDNGAPYYTTDRAAAMEVLERCCEYLKSSYMVWKDNGMWYCNIVLGGPMLGEAETLPLAICCFAKKLFSK